MFQQVAGDYVLTASHSCCVFSMVGLEWRVQGVFMACFVHGLGLQLSDLDTSRCVHIDMAL